jgi:hypothetical protein
MNEKQKLQLQKMVSENNVVDQTELIRELKHSSIFKEEIAKMLILKNKYKGDQEKIHYECMNECNFLFTYYTDIYNKIRKDEIDLTILLKFVDVLRRIEERELDQHEASFLVGTLLKELYIDSALKKADKLNQLDDSIEEPEREKVDISWKKFKHMKS